MSNSNSNDDRLREYVASGELYVRNRPTSIIFMAGDYDVRLVRTGYYEVVENGLTHGKLKATFVSTDKPEWARKRAVARCKQLAGVNES